MGASEAQTQRRPPGGATFGNAQTQGDGPNAEDDTAALRRLRGVLDDLAIEAHIAFTCARAAHYTGGVEHHDGARLRMAYERLRRYAQYVADAQQEVSR